MTRTTNHKRIALFGSTGSIGKQALEVISFQQRPVYRGNINGEPQRRPTDTAGASICRQTW